MLQVPLAAAMTNCRLRRVLFRVDQLLSRHKASWHFIAETLPQMLWGKHCQIPDHFDTRVTPDEWRSLLSVHFRRQIAAAKAKRHSGLHVVLLAHLIAKRALDLVP